MGSTEDSSEDSTRPIRGFSRTQQRDSGSNHSAIAVGRISVPIMMVITVIMTTITAAGFWFKVNSHTENSTVHLNEHDVIMGGGPAYQNDVRRLQSEFESRLRRMLAGIKVLCRVTSRQTLESTCSMVLPDIE